jgi:hypothetical protein
VPVFTGSLETHPSYKPLLASFKVLLRFVKKVDEEGVAIEESTSVQTDGSYRLAIDDHARADAAATVSVLGPTSETVSGGQLSDLLSDGQKLKPIKISGAAPKIPVTELPPSERTPLRRVSVRVFVASAGVLTGKAAPRVYVQISGKLKRPAE